MLDPHCHTPTLNQGWRASSPHKPHAHAVLHLCNRQGVLHFIFRHRYCRPGVEYQQTLLQTSNQTPTQACPRRQPIKDSEAAIGKNKKTATQTNTASKRRKPQTAGHQRTNARKHRSNQTNNTTTEQKTCSELSNRATHRPASEPASPASEQATKQPNNQTEKQQAT